MLHLILAQQNIGPAGSRDFFRYLAHDLKHWESDLQITVPYLVTLGPLRDPYLVVVGAASRPLNLFHNLMLQSTR